MKKETIFAIILGVAAGIGVAFFMVLKARENQFHNAKPLSTLNVTPSITIRNDQLQSLEVTSPTTGFTTTEKTITIKGKATKDGLLIVQSPIKQIAQKLTSDNFTLEDFPVALGENVIRVSFYPKNPQITSQEKEIKVYYITE